MENINNLIESNLKLCYADLKSIEAAKIDILKAVANEIEQFKKLNIDDVSKRLDLEIEKRKKITDVVGCETHRELTKVMKEIEHLRAVSRILKD